jgi:hypothetical protein
MSAFALPIVGTIFVLAAGFLYAGIELKLRFHWTFAVLLPLSYGVGVGYGLGWLARVFKCRNPSYLHLHSILFALLALYGAWVSFVFLTATNVGWQEWLGLFLRPGLLWEAMQLINRYGTFSFGSGKEPVTGIVLSLIWIAEAILILALVYFIARIGLVSRVFCERCGQWARPWNLLPAFKWLEDQTVLKQICTGDLAATAHLVRATPLENPKLVLSVLECPQCHATATWRLSQETMIPDGKGGSNKTTDHLTGLLLVTPEQLQMIADSTKGAIRNRSFQS